MTGDLRRSLLNLVAHISAFLALASLGFGATTAPSTPQAALPTVNDRCPVMKGEFATPLHEIQYGGVAVRFCCEECRDRFLSDPVPYLADLPQMPLATVHAIVAQSQERGRLARATGWADRWTRPVL